MVGTQGTGTRNGCEFPRLQGSAIFTDHTHRSNRLACFTFYKYESHALGIGFVSVAPMGHREQDGLQVEPLCGKHILWLSTPFDGTPLQNSFYHQTIETAGKNVAGNAETALKLTKALHAEEGIVQSYSFNMKLLFQSVAVIWPEVCLVPKSVSALRRNWQPIKEQTNHAC